MILWIKEGSIPDNVIVAELPRGNNEDSQHLRELVQKFQVHTCRPNRCFCTTSGKVITRCKYGFPQKLQNKDGIDRDGIRFEYKRTEQEDRYIVLTMLMLFKCGVHIEMVSDLNTKEQNKKTDALSLQSLCSSNVGCTYLYNENNSKWP